MQCRRAFYAAQDVYSRTDHQQAARSVGAFFEGSEDPCGLQEAWHCRADYGWRKEYGGLRTDQAKRMKELEKENARLKKLVASGKF